MNPELVISPPIGDGDARSEVVAVAVMQPSPASRLASSVDAQFTAAVVAE
jgi:hypothetical protein